MTAPPELAPTDAAPPELARPELAPTALDLTLRQLEVAGAIQSFTDEHGYPPTLREIGALVGLASASSVLHHVRLLEHGGIVVRERGRARTVAVVDETFCVAAVLGRAPLPARHPDTPE